jgi:hypothetical protein
MQRKGRQREAGGRPEPDTGAGPGADLPALYPTSNQKTIFVILSAAKNLSFNTAEIRNEAALRSE